MSDTVHITSATGICPHQATGTYRGYAFYLRARHDTVWVYIAPAGTDLDPVTGTCISEVPEAAVYPLDATRAEAYPLEATRAHIATTINAWITIATAHSPWILHLTGETTPLPLDPALVAFLHDTGLAHPEITLDGDTDFATLTYPDGVVPAGYATNVARGIVHTVITAAKQHTQNGLLP